METEGDGPNVVHGREREQQDAEPRRDATTEQSENTYGERNVGGGRYSPTSPVGIGA